MLTMDDVLDYCDLDRDEIAAIAQHEHIPMAVAAELGDHLLETPEGIKELYRMVRDNMAHAKQEGNTERYAEWSHAYQHLRKTHPVTAHHA